ncbi:MAG: MSCRAMM family protein [Terriglobales bacterium]
MKLWASFLILISLPLTAQQPAEKPPEKASAKGMVIKAGTDESVRRATVRLESFEQESRKYQAATDAEGRFEIKDIEPGRYSLQVEREGFRVERLGVGSAWVRSRENLPVVLSAGQKLDIIALLVPGGVVAGRILDADGEPVSNVEVRIMHDRFYSGRRRLLPVQQATTNDLGEYRLHGLRAGSYYLQADPQQRWDRGPVAAPGKSERKGTLAYATTFYPGVVERADAARLQIKAGEEMRADFSLVAVRAVNVSGRLIGPAAPEAGTRVMLVPSEGFSFGFRENAEVAKDGTFQIEDVLPGSYTLVAFQPSPSGWGQLASLKVEVGKEDIDDLALTLVPSGKTAVRGRVRIEGSSSVELASLLVFLRPAEEDDSLSMMGFSRRGRGMGTVKADGTFEFEDVTDGTYRVEVVSRPRGRDWSTAISGLYLKAATVGKSDARDEGFTISEGHVAGPVEIVLSTEAAQIEGVVLDDQQKPVAGIRVRAAPEEKHRHLQGWYKSETTDQNGRFLMRGVRPGAYTVFALDSSADVYYGSNDPDMIKRYEDKGVTVTVKENDRKAVEVKAIKVEEEP